MSILKQKAWLLAVLILLATGTARAQEMSSLKRPAWISMGLSLNPTLPSLFRAWDDMALQASFRASYGFESGILGGVRPYQVRADVIARYVALAEEHAHMTLGITTGQVNSRNSRIMLGLYAGPSFGLSYQGEGPDNVSTRMTVGVVASAQAVAKFRRGGGIGLEVVTNVNSFWTTVQPNLFFVFGRL